MLAHLVDLAVEYVAARLEQAAKEALSPVAPYLRRLALGTVMIFVSTTGFMLALCAFIAALFLVLAGLPYAAAVAYTGLASLGTSLIITIWGASMVRPPR